MPELEQDRLEARRLLGDIVSDSLDRIGLAAVIKKHMPRCNCGARRAVLNNIHRRLMRIPE